ncbi:hypothetical protein GCM10023191_087690 [Actinoallomurus oryzae]|uniref:UvrD-like helicase C-terminal domain-containing protein n=1 Tax=Actinoallomurus oryzae TaxID=502180 RepID=A0ABP8R2M1_9ACTN
MTLRNKGSGFKPRESSDSLFRKAQDLQACGETCLALLDQQVQLAIEPPHIMTAALLLKDALDLSDDGVRIATMHAMKGLEFRCVAAVGVNERAFSFEAAVTPADVDRMQHEVDMLAERSLLFVACTHARDDLYISWHGKPSPFIPGT